MADIERQVAYALNTPCGHTRNYDAEADCEIAEEPLTVGDCPICRVERIAAAIQATAEAGVGEHVYSQVREAFVLEARRVGLTALQGEATDAK
jgi:hypothetical protein